MALRCIYNMKRRIFRYFEGKLSKEEIAELLKEIQESPEARREFITIKNFIALRNASRGIFSQKPFQYRQRPDAYQIVSQRPDASRIIIHHKMFRSAAVKFVAAATLTAGLFIASLAIFNNVREERALAQISIISDSISQEAAQKGSATLMLASGQEMQIGDGAVLGSDIDEFVKNNQRDVEGKSVSERRSVSERKSAGEGKLASESKSAGESRSLSDSESVGDSKSSNGRSVKDGRSVKSSKSVKDGKSVKSSKSVAGDQVQEPKYNSVTATSKNDYQLIMYDGTKVWLKKGSTICFPDKFNKNRRFAELKGEAYFEIAKNSDWPFDIKTGETVVTVLGTEFYLSYARKAGDFKISMVSGKVSVIRNKEGISQSGGDGNSANEPILLTKNQVLSIDASGNYSISNEDCYAHKAWTQGYFLFINRTLPSILKQLSDWYEVDIVLLSEKFNQAKFNGKYSSQKGLDELIKTLQLSYDFTFYMDEGVIYIK